MSDPFYILSLSGGGYLGLYTIAVLAALEEASGVPIARRFDLIAGTSVGGIIALGLAAEVPAAQIKEAFERDGTSIFSERPATRGKLGALRDLARYWCKPKYSSDPLRQTVAGIVGAQTRIGDLKHPVIVPAVNLTKGGPQLFKTPHHPDFSHDLKLQVTDVALATAAAPTYFPVAEIGNSLFADGGLYANSPDLLAVHEAETFFERSEKDIHLLSIGTTTSQFSFSHANGRQLGAFAWMSEQRLVSVIIAAQQHYLRIDALQSKEQERDLALDIATPSARSTIKGLAEASVQSNINNPRLRGFLSYLAPPSRFFHSIA